MPFATRPASRGVGSGDYFRYRILELQPTPFSFSDVMQKAESVFNEAPPYEQNQRHDSGAASPTFASLGPFSA